MQDLLVPGWYPSNLRDALVLGLGPRLLNSNILFGHILQFSMLMALSEFKKVEIVNHGRTKIRGLCLCTWSSTANWLVFIKKGYYDCFRFGIVYLVLLCRTLPKQANTHAASELHSKQVQNGHFSIVWSYGALCCNRQICWGIEGGRGGAAMLDQCVRLVFHHPREWSAVTQWSFSARADKKVF